MRLILFLLCLLASPVLAAPMTFELQGNGGNCNGCEWIAAKGEITPQTPDDFRTFLENHGRLYLYQAVTFDSPGGNLGAAIELGRLLRATGASTSIGRSEPMEDAPQFHEAAPGGRCESACVFAFLGGDARWVYGEKLGIHRFYASDGRNIPTAATQQIMGQIVLYLIEMGISPEMLTLASRIPDDQMHYLTEDELARLGIETASETTPARLEVDHGGLVLRWEAKNDDGSVDRYQELRCSKERSSWVLSVVDTDIGPNNGVVSEDSADFMYLMLGQKRFPMNWGHVYDVQPIGKDYKLVAGLPIDLRNHAGEEMQFQTNDARNFWMVLSASLTLPNADTLDAMVRACGN